MPHRSRIPTRKLGVILAKITALMQPIFCLHKSRSHQMRATMDGRQYVEFVCLDCQRTWVKPGLNR